MTAKNWHLAIYGAMIGLSETLLSSEFAGYVIHGLILITLIDIKYDK